MFKPFQRVNCIITFIKKIDINETLQDNIYTTMEVMKYNLNDFKVIISGGFDVTLPDFTISTINELANQVGSPTYIRTPIFQKLESVSKVGGSMSSSSSSSS